MRERLFVSKISICMVALLAVSSLALATTQVYTVVVTDGATGEPIEGAYVRLIGELTNYSGFTNASGEITFEVVYGDYELIVSANGFDTVYEEESFPTMDRRRCISTW